jgi:hypothetical protein
MKNNNASLASRMVSRLVLCLFLTTGSAFSQGIVEYFKALPPSGFLEGTTAQLLDIMKRAEGKSFIDTKNGYMYLEGDGAQVSLQVALFRFDDKTPLLVVAHGELEEESFTKLSFFTEVKKKMVPMERSIFPVANGPKRKFTLPHKGRTIIVSHASGKEESRWTWEDEAFVKE